MSLQKYWQKRDFDITPEPRGKVTKSAEALNYYIQRHHATRLHYDFRLELNGTLKSWAIPKGPSLNPTDKRLAVHVEDHPLSYGTFVGQIPKGQYGAGQVVLWDKGIWLPIGDPEKGYKEGNLKFELQGVKLAGKWALVRMKPRADDDSGKENWLLIKEKDDEAKEGDDSHITDLRPESVLKIKGKKAAANKDLQLSQHLPAKPRLTYPVKEKLSKTKLPDFLSPELATLVKSAPVGDEWISEVKFDGYRALSRIAHSKAVIYTRNGNDWTRHWPAIAEQLAKLPVDEAWLDGEVVAIKDGKINFGALQNYEANNHGIQLKYYLFDLIHLNGQDISHFPLEDRKALLKEILSSQSQDSLLQYSEHIVGHAKDAFKSACEQGIEGIVIKNRTAPYVQARNHNWLKLKCSQRQEFVIAGFTEPEGSRQGFGALLVGYYNEKKELIYAGRVGTGFNTERINKLSKRLKALVIETPAFKNPPKGYEARGVSWLKPQLVCEVNFAEWTADGIVRHASFIEMRDDKPAQQISREQAVNVKAIEVEESSVREVAVKESSNKLKTESSEKIDKKTSPKTSENRPTENESVKNKSSQNKSSEIKSSEIKPNDKSMEKKIADSSNTIMGIAISHPERIVYAPEKLTKLNVAEYYQAVEKWLMPHLIGRPLSLLRCPDGTEKECFFQKHLDDFRLKHIQKIDVDANDKGKYLIANNISAVIELVQMGVIELHTWGSTIEDLHKPDRFIFDLDPDTAVPWEKVIEGASLVRYLLDNLGLKSFLKTTGGKGLHIVVPIKPEHDFPVIKAFTKGIATHLAKTIPTHFIDVMSKEKRKNKIFIDYLRNGEEATAIAAYSLRARPTAPISVPLRWDELNADLKSYSFNMQNIYERLLNLSHDPWEDYFTTQQIITTQMLETFK